MPQQFSESSLEGILEGEHEETTHDHSDDDDDAAIPLFHPHQAVPPFNAQEEEEEVPELPRDDEEEDEDEGVADLQVDFGYEDMDAIADRRNSHDFSLPRQSSKRSSLMRRVSTESEQTSQSAPPGIGGPESDLAALLENNTTQRRVTVHGRSTDANVTSSLRGAGRFRVSSRGGGAAVDHASSSASTSSTASTLDKSSFVSALMQRRRSTRHPVNHHKSLAAPHHHTSSSMADAVERLSSLPTSDVEYVSAAAAVVAATAPGKRNNICQFSQGDHVLVILALLGLADPAGNKDLYTIDPVNQQGYPRSGGKGDTSSTQGPFLYVLCVVTQVHFDEDERYYTVRRCDTGTEQRADPGYMEPIRDVEAIDAAYQAALRTHLAVPQGPGVDRPFVSLRQAAARWRNAVTRRVVPWYQRSRLALKVQMQRLWHGESGWAVHWRFSGINFLVCCSLIFLFHDVFALAFLPTKYYFSFLVLGLVVWVILVIEIFLEFLIRPKDYQALVRSDKAFAPSTARMLNRFHFVTESVALLLYLPQSICGFHDQCDSKFSGSQRSLLALTADTESDAALGRLLLGLIFLRSFGLARHWKQMWLNHTYERGEEESSVVRRLLLVEKGEGKRRFFRRKKQDDYSTSLTQDSEHSQSPSKVDTVTSEEDEQLKNAATIGTSLMVVNSHRALMILISIICLFPIFYSGLGSNPVDRNQVRLLQGNNIAANSTVDCDFLNFAVQSWLKSSSVNNTAFDVVASSGYGVLWAQLLPIRCDWQGKDGVITKCSSDAPPSQTSACNFWNKKSPYDPNDATVEYYSEVTGARPGGIVEITSKIVAPASFVDGQSQATFFVRALFNESHVIILTNGSQFILLALVVLFGLFGLTVMRSDTERLVLSPLHRMLSIVVRYAENPLSSPSAKESRRKTGNSTSLTDDDTEEQLGHYETEQLISAIAKIADLLRKCWGVAGAGIISSNLARTKDGRTVVFNPTIPGKQVYALFGFIGINNFSRQLRSLEQEVMILINDVARVVHDEVYRWALGDSGQCNKNLGSAFLMVFRIGDFMEVHDKKKRATDVVFDSQLKIEKTRLRHQGSTMPRRQSNSIPFDLGRDGTLQLASLPGIQTFADRALLGCLKSFAGLHRDQNMQAWQKDFRLGAGVGNYHISVIYGMDAGWAVEGAVGSEYKIDATYLSPHVNMASRMMSACKQYGVKVLVSQAVEELLSKTARSKLRHLDTVFVKGSNVAQRIYTYDARYEGVDFFLFERTPDQADIEAEAYNPSIWDNDQDLKSMRQHVTDDFMKKFQLGVEQYLDGQWKAACRSLEAADTLMFEAVLEQGFVDYITEDLGEYGKNLKISKLELARLKNEFGDGACKCLLQYMQRRNCIPPPDWNGVRHLMSK